MKNPHSKKPPKSFDIHRTLPRHHQVPRQHHPQQEVPRQAAALPKPPQQKPRRKLTWKKIVAFLLLLPILLTLIIAVWDARNFSKASTKMFGSGNILDLVFSSDPKGSERGRINILIVGYSVDDPGHPGANLTDSIMILSMDTTDRTGYMLSIPRDLYVRIPGHGSGKINEAYGDGGMDLLEQIIENNFSIPIDYSVLVNYASVREVVNALGGINVNIASKDPRGLYDPNISHIDGGPLLLSNGPQVLNGQTALNLTRARGDAFGSYGFPQADFDRTQHQRQVFAAIKEKLTWKLILNPKKNGQVFDAFANNVKTNVQLSEVRPLYSIFNSIPSSSLQSLSLRNINGKNLLRSSNLSGSTLSPAAGTYNYSQIVQALQPYNQ